MSKKCGLIALGLGVAAGYIAGKYGDVIVNTIKDSCNKKSVDDLLDEMKADSEERVEEDWVKDSYIVLPEDEDVEVDIEVSKLDFPEFLKNLKKKEEELGIDITVDSETEATDKKEDKPVEEVKPKKKTVKKPAAKKENKSEEADK